MKHYRIVKFVEISPGTVVALSPEQAGPRAHRLESLGDGRYRTKELMQFKAGERLGLAEYVIPKAHEDRFELVDVQDDGAAEPGAADPLEAEPAANPLRASGFRRGRR